MVYYVNGEVTEVDLKYFLPIAYEEQARRDRYMTTNNMFNLYQTTREKSEMGYFSDYPHFYTFSSEQKESLSLYAKRETENGDFIVSMEEGDYTKFGQNYVAEVKANFWGTGFDVYNYGVDENLLTDLPVGFLPVR